MFLSQIFESTVKHAAFCFGRMNPPTLGHGQVIDTVAQASQGGDYFIFASSTQDAKNNPLDYATKIKFLRAMFPEQASHIVNDPSLKTIMQVAEWLYAQGYRSVTFVAGSDRLDSFKQLLTSYNGVEGKNVYYKFDSIDFVSSGERDPDAEGIAGISASGAREAAREGNLQAFADATGAGNLAKPLYDAVRKGLLLEGQVDESDEIQVENKKIYTFLRAVVNWWNNKNPDNRITYDGPGMRVWTRGDGTRSRDPAKLTSYTNTREPIDMLWATLSKMTGVKPAGTVSHEFPSMGSNDAIAFKGFILVKRDRRIDVMTRSRVSNPNSVWRQTNVEEDAAGVGVVATNKKMAQDPRYSMSMTQDVHPDTPAKNLKALRLG